MILENINSWWQEYEELLRDEKSLNGGLKQEKTWILSPENSQ